MAEKLIVSSSPHIKAGITTHKIMLDVIIALIPACIASIIYFGWQAAMLLVVSVITCVVSEYICRKVMKRDNTIGDLSAVVTGLLVAMNVPSSLNPFMMILGDVAAIVVVKQMFGGIGQNFVNPALIGRIVLMNSFPGPMSSWTMTSHAIDGATTATPLAVVKMGLSDPLPSYLQMFLGNRGGCLGETCGLALLIGFAYLLIRKVISPVIPLCYVGTAAVMSALLGRDVLFDLLAGGLLLGAIFMATDYTTSPITIKGQVIYAIGCGVLTILIRKFGALPEGVSYSIIIMNLLVPLIERGTRPRTFGKERAKK
ncbi:MAG: RnfABCDGE type electron transport complex subunit D [Clostridiales bacterium]|jgi:electron transport complex protein RnfD|nr:RnfABCDGE type electron transport complex subunit D [Clostridiales bacterium]MCI1960811.1 RnfABCDGE type electron transport complex subunit D [Clostridiales bacterium]MCI2021252.1 RnfABCDGE type electron transport complex subunit D [Clostridiales bacterium]MCI2025635.1 RnfABCDGE type electron transport complex subunit D [Clostridiales bacterium]